MTEGYLFLALDSIVAHYETLYGHHFAIIPNIMKTTRTVIRRRYEDFPSVFNLLEEFLQDPSHHHTPEQMERNARELIRSNPCPRSWSINNFVRACNIYHKNMSDCAVCRQTDVMDSLAKSLNFCNIDREYDSVSEYENYETMAHGDYGFSKVIASMINTISDKYHHVEESESIANHHKAIAIDIMRRYGDVESNTGHDLMKMRDEFLCRFYRS